MALTISDLLFVEKVLLGLLLLFVAEIIGHAYDVANKSIVLTTLEEAIVGCLTVSVLVVVGILTKRLRGQKNRCKAR